MAKQTVLDDQVKSIVKKFKQLLVADVSLGVEDVIVFGSHAKGNSSEYSDIDVAVVSSKCKHNYHDYLLKLLAVRRQLDISIEPHPILPEDLTNKYFALGQEIARFGIRV